MKILSANVNGRVDAAARRQMAAVLDEGPDVIALQEVTLRNYTGWCKGLTQAGYAVISAIDLVALPYPAPPYPSPPFPPRQGRSDGQIPRRNFNLLAARHPIAPLPGLVFAEPEEARFAFPEKYVAGRLVIDSQEVDIHNAHVPPGSSRGVIKVHAFEAIRRRVDATLDVPRILCGDFNAPWSEDASGPKPERRRSWSDEIKQRWLAAELAIVANPDMRDVYRDVHQRGQCFPTSHVTGRTEQTPHRYDYLFASSNVGTVDCRYLTEWLEHDRRGRRLSDHAPVVAKLALPHQG